ncbi:MAG: hypothetical protein A3D63_03640 [Candidatus Wildermuthbacteria bacterium RIFCSPHIGHO2_02_FULL_49_17]|nr:MAG: hypothetical protein A3D63_03640 [Candidatus Wildermuthbacteria bacterium RIFCSPHIGHO2_02_FULL_49_17]
MENQLIVLCRLASYHIIKTMRILDLIFPRRCLGCQREGSHCCEDCLSLLSIAPAPSILAPRSALAALFCATSFQDPFAQRLIHAFKYPPFLRDLAKPLAFSIISHFALCNKPIYPPDVICPIPLHKKRLKWRGYNHAEELAKQLGYAFSLPVVPDALLKIAHTAPQVNLDGKTRLSSVRGVFRTDNARAIAGKNVLLVDDVYTTGATMEECARVLKKAGAEHVLGAVVARG